jgi:hypothetical protein
VSSEKVRLPCCSGIQLHMPGNMGGFPDVSLECPFSSRYTNIA